MRTVDLRGASPHVSELVFGCASLGSRYDRTQSLRALAIAYDHGINAFDTARSYGYGESESIVGEFARGRRESVVISTKAGIRASARAQQRRILRDVARRAFSFAPSLRGMLGRKLAQQRSHGHFQPSDIRESVEESLRQLETDHVDILFLHDVPADRACADEVLELLDALRSEGKVLLAGPSTHPAALLEIGVSERALGDAVQFSISAAHFGSWRHEFVSLISGRRPALPIRFGNQPFAGGSALHPGLEGRLRALGALHEVRLRLPLVAGFCDAVVTAMLDPDHIVANCRALSDPAIPEADLRALASSLLRAKDENACVSTN